MTGGKMSELTQKELEQGKKVLGGIIILFWVTAIITGLGLLSVNYGNWFTRSLHVGPITVSPPASDMSILFLAVFVIELVGLYIRKPFAVPLGRAGLVVTMVIFFPVGTIFGAILWKRINDPAAKKYLNYGITEEKPETKDIKEKQDIEVNQKNEEEK